MRIILATWLVIISWTLGYSQISFRDVCERDDLIEDDIIFVHLHTDWCGLCRLMERTVFTDSEIGNFHNEHFLNLSWNPELYLGDEAKRREVLSYPTYLYLRNDEVIYRYTGALEKEAFLEMSKKVVALESQNLSLVDMIKAIDKKDFYGRYLIANDSMQTLIKKENPSKEEISYLIDHLSQVNPELLLEVTNKIAAAPLSYKLKQQARNQLMAFYTSFLKQHSDEKERAKMQELISKIPPKVNPGI